MIWRGALWETYFLVNCVVTSALLLIVLIITQRGPFCNIWLLFFSWLKNELCGKPTFPYLSCHLSPAANEQTQSSTVRGKFPAFSPSSKVISVSSLSKVAVKWVVSEFFQRVSKFWGALDYELSYFYILFSWKKLCFTHMFWHQNLDDLFLQGWDGNWMGWDLVSKIRGNVMEDCLRRRDGVLTAIETQSCGHAQI